MEILSYPEEMKNAKYKPKGASWIDINTNPVSLANLLERHNLITPHKLIRKLWCEFKLKKENFDRIRLKMKGK